MQATRYIIDSNGKLIETISGVEEIVNLNSVNKQYVEVAPYDVTDYWDYSSNNWVSIGSKPKPYHIFDYSIKAWIDPRDLEQVKIDMWGFIKFQRNILETSGFVFEGGLYDSDEISQGRIMGAALAGMDQVWTLKDNSTRLLTAAQLVELYAAMAQHVAQCHERGRIARAAIEVAQTKEEVEAVTL